MRKVAESSARDVNGCYRGAICVLRPASEEVPANQHPGHRSADAASCFVDHECYAFFSADGAHHEIRYYLCKTIYYLIAGPLAHRAPHQPRLLGQGRVHVLHGSLHQPIVGMFRRTGAARCSADFAKPHASWRAAVNACRYAWRALSEGRRTGRLPPSASW